MLPQYFTLQDVSAYFADPHGIDRRVSLLHTFLTLTCAFAVLGLVALRHMSFYVAVILTVFVTFTVTYLSRHALKRLAIKTEQRQVYKKLQKQFSLQSDLDLPAWTLLGECFLQHPARKLLKKEPLGVQETASVLTKDGFPGTLRELFITARTLS